MAVKYFDTLEEVVKMLNNPQIEALVDTSEFYAHKIKQSEETIMHNIFKENNSQNCYLGYLAFAFIKVNSADQRQYKIGTEILSEIIIDHADKLEPYILLFTVSKNFGSEDDQIQMLDKLFLFFNNQPRSLREKLVITEVYAKALCRHEQFHRAFNLLQIEFAKHPSFATSLLYLYGKLVVKHR